MKRVNKWLTFLFLLYVSVSYSQKWYYHSMHEKMAIADTSTNVVELNKCDEVFKRILVSRPADTMALYYHFLANCLKHFYSKTVIYEEEQKKINLSLKILDSVFVSKEELQIAELFYRLLCVDLYGDISIKNAISAMINKLKESNPDNPRVFFIETYAAVKYQKCTEEELEKCLKIYTEKYGVYQQSERLKINWGDCQMKYLKKYFK